MAGTCGNLTELVLLGWIALKLLSAGRISIRPIILIISDQVRVRLKQDCPDALLLPDIQKPRLSPAPLLGLSASGCGRNVVKQTEAEPRLAANDPVPPTSVPMWLGTPERNFYGSGPWPDRPLEVIWEFETELTSGRLHKEGWGGSSWPGQPSVSGERVYFGSADGYLYCLDTRDGRLIWSFKDRRQSEDNTDHRRESSDCERTGPLHLLPERK